MTEIDRWSADQLRSVGQISTYGPLPGSGGGDYIPSNIERIMQSRVLEAVRPGRTDRFDVSVRYSTKSNVHLLRATDGSWNIYKPIALQTGFDVDPEFGVAIVRNEIATFRVDQLLGYGRVPPTALVDGPLGLGSIQQWVRSKPYRPHRRIPEVQKQQMAILDFVCANADRHEINCRLDRRKSIVAIDNGANFDEKFESSASLFTDDFRGKKLDSRLLADLREVDSTYMRSALRDSGLDRNAIDSAMARLAEVQKNGMIPDKSLPQRIEGPFDWL
ncbi:hypothetical protein [Nocardia brasiliensis]|uniref:hypothetical protein n=1 Tax=Nocardia brasiliensis TaxID=37326 RepID=UPI003D9358DA